MTFTLFPKGAPGEIAGAVGTESDTTSLDGELVGGKRVIRLGNVTVPTITIYRPPQYANGTAVVVCPGGGYSILAYDLEGTEVCEFLNSLGITAILLKYRVPARPGQARYAAPLQDVQRALGIVRGRAVEFGIDPDRIGILGFSAGAHLSALLSTGSGTARTYELFDDADLVDCRPNFAALIYPGSLYAADSPNHIAPELAVSPMTSPTFLAQAEDDGVGVENSLYYYLALKARSVPAEMHIFSKGGHGYGLRASNVTIPTAWPRLLAEWLREGRWIPEEQVLPTRQ